MEDVLGYIKTHWDCPNCGAMNEEEGEMKGEGVHCITCEEEYVISEIR